MPDRYTPVIKQAGCQPSLLAGKAQMSHLTADGPAVALGACIGLAAGLYALRVLSQAISHDHRDEAQTTALPSGVRWLLGLASAAAGALVGARFGLHASLAAYLYLVAIAPALSAVDAATRRMPDRILLPAYPASAALLGYAAWNEGSAEALWRALLAGALLYAIFLAVALVAPPGSLGWADVLTELAKVRR